MRFLLIVLLISAAFGQTVRQTQSSNTTENLRGASVVSEQVAWASGSHGTYLRTMDGGHTWNVAQVPSAATLDFRGVVAFSAEEAFLMSSGPGEQSRIYHTSDGGQHWQLQFTGSNPKTFFDSIAFWDSQHGVVLGDPVPDQSGQLKFQLLVTSDGQTWTPIASSQMPTAAEGEGAFAASNSCIAIRPDHILGDQIPGNQGSGAAAVGKAEERARVKTKDGAASPGSNIWFATGGKVARVFHSADRGLSWEVFPTPIVHGADSAGIFSIAFRDANHGVIAGGDYKHPDWDGPNLAFTNDGGKSWSLSQIYPQSYYSAVTYDRGAAAHAAAGLEDSRAHVRLFLVAPKFIFDFRPPRDPTRISPPKKSGIGFNAVSTLPGGGAFFVGPKGSIATIP